MHKLIREGVKIQGFEFTDGYYNNGRLRYNPDMAEFCGQVGEVFSIDETSGLCGVHFVKSNKIWYYPTEEVVNHIIGE